MSLELPPIVLGNDKETIRREVRRLDEMVAPRRGQITALKAEIAAIYAIQDLYQQRCKHPGQKTGYNERDGYWTNPCPVCGASD